MNTNKLWTKLLMAATLLALLFSAACSADNDIKGPDEVALAEQGDVVMTVLKDGDLQAVRGLLNREAQQMLDKATHMAGRVVDVESIIEQNKPEIAAWTFDQARIFTRDGAIRGELDGKVEYVDGKSGKVHLNLVQQDDTWKLSGWTLDQ